MVAQQVGMNTLPAGVPQNPMNPTAGRGSVPANCNCAMSSFSFNNLCYCDSQSILINNCLQAANPNWPFLPGGVQIGAVDPRSDDYVVTCITRTGAQSMTGVIGGVNGVNGMNGINGGPRRNAAKSKRGNVKMILTAVAIFAILLSTRKKKRKNLEDKELGTSISDVKKMKIHDFLDTKPSFSLANVSTGMTWTNPKEAKNETSENTLVETLPKPVSAALQIEGLDNIDGNDSFKVFDFVLNVNETESLESDPAPVPKHKLARKDSPPFKAPSFLSLFPPPK